MNKPNTYSYSTDDEFYFGEFYSPAAAAAEAFCGDPDLEIVCIGENCRHTAHFYVNAERILEDIAENAYDECGEASEYWLYKVLRSPEMKAELEQLIGDWLQKKDPPNFWQVVNICSVTRAEHFEKQNNEGN